MKKALNIRPPLFALGFLFVAFTIHFLFLPSPIISSDFRLLGIVFVILGLSFILWARVLFKKKGTAILPTDNPTHFVNSGPYRFTRNPMYLGIVLILLGIAIWVGTLPLFFAPLGFFLTVQSVFIPYEEKNMERTFGREYLEYRKKVRQWL